MSSLLWLPLGFCGLFSQRLSYFTALHARPPSDAKDHQRPAPGRPRRDDRTAQLVLCCRGIDSSGLAKARKHSGRCPPDGWPRSSCRRTSEGEEAPPSG